MPCENPVPSYLRLKTIRTINGGRHVIGREPVFRESPRTTIYTPERPAAAKWTTR